ncbi:hypothetical protein CONCODRAFT_76994 [Conidiobolus coronatus NRRL 28638]|uniref:ER membrane protein complex subunit 6 n=1 Tax=Conidiobolus coronatus (strain ATCC 28846 / CBS 209.66 / NRRL 28638) TaxID=796925 RepID=A0A137PGI7_CONC2|nr:hypothetical protein CONCODRAFT_76994 [Conidiobolus coronatus NRRL 28638]|eukprot:KXN74119.1 hypothetical protein CONCODRAFT_76994 [Conidiobolus coronatus NRRL 28638]
MKEELNSKYDQQLLTYNLQRITHLKSIFCILSGSTCGILGYTNWAGFIFYIVSAALLNLLLFVTINLKSKLNKVDYIDGFYDVASIGLLSDLPSFILFWTLAYGLVHIYI